MKNIREDGGAESGGRDIPANPWAGQPGNRDSGFQGQSGPQQEPFAWDNQPHLTQPLPPTQYHQPVSGAATRTRGLLITAVVILFLAVSGALGFLFFNGKQSDGTRSSNADAPVTVTVESTVIQSADGGETDRGQRSEPAATTAPTAREARPAGSTGGSPVLPSAALNAGLTLDGWSDNAATRCSPGQDLVYAGKGADAWVTVCGSASGMTYRSDVFGGTLSAPVDLSQSNPANGSFVVPVSPSVIRVAADRVLVYENGSVVAAEDLASSWIID